MDEPSQGIDGEKLDLPLNQEPSTAAPEFEIKYEIDREKKTANSVRMRANDRSWIDPKRACRWYQER